MAKNLAKKVVAKMFDNDPFTKWLGIDVIKIEPGFCILKMKVRKEMLNGFGIAHGGITFSLADSALAIASNSHGRMAVSVETSISHIKPLVENDIIIGEAKEESCSNKIGIYTIKLYKASDTSLVALFKGTVYRTSEDW